MKRNWRMVVVALALFAGSLGAQAGEKWHKVGELNAGGKLAVDREITAVRLVGLDGICIVNTLVIFNGDTKQGIPVTAKIKKGEEREVPLGKTAKATHVGMSLNADATGRLAVYVK